MTASNLNFQASKPLQGLASGLSEPVFQVPQSQSKYLRILSKSYSNALFEVQIPPVLRSGGCAELVTKNFGWAQHVIKRA